MSLPHSTRLSYSPAGIHRLEGSPLLRLIMVTLALTVGCSRNDPAARSVKAEPLDQTRKFIQAARTGDIALIDELLKAGIDIDVRPALGITALWQACWSGQTECAIALLERGADPNLYDQGFQRSPLMLAKDPNLITMLVAAGAEDAAAVLYEAALEGSSEKVAAVLEGRDFTHDELMLAKANAQMMQRREIADLLDAAAGGELSSLPPFETTDLHLLAGDYRDARLEQMLFRVRQRHFVLEEGGNAPQVLLPTGESTFQRGSRTYRFLSDSSGEFQVQTFIASRLRSVHTRDRPTETTSENPADPVGDAAAMPSANPLAEESEDPVEALASYDTWPQFRGHAARGIAREQDLPAEFSTQRDLNILWNTPIPGFGVSSPIVWKDKVFLTTAVRDRGTDEVIVGDYESGQTQQVDAHYTWKLVCLGSATGRVVWDQTMASGPSVGRRHPKSSFANPTPATDGKYVVALVNSGHLQCFTVEGNLVWEKDLGPLTTGAVVEPEFEWGFASSPIIYESLVVLQCDLIDKSYLAAYDLRTGSLLWKTERDEPPSWATPLVYLETEGPRVVTSGSKSVRAYDLDSGDEIWKLPGMSAITVPTPQFWNDRLYLSSGQLPTQPILSVQTGPLAGNASTPTVDWAHERGGPYVITPLVYRGNLYSCSTNGVLTCYDARTGRQIYRKRIARSGADSFSASPVAADGRIYFAAETGAIVEVQAGTQFAVNGVHAIGDYCLATPAIAGGRLFVRTRHSLIAIGDGDGVVP